MSKNKKKNKRKNKKKRKRQEKYIPNTNIPRFELRYKEDERITSKIGLGIFGQVYEKLGVTKQIRQIFPEPGSWKGYRAEEYIKPIVLNFVQGGQYLEDVGKSVKDEVLRMMCGIKRVPSSDAIGDWLRRESKEKTEGIKAINDRVIDMILREDKREEYTIDLDATVIESWKEEAEWTYKRHKGYTPIIGYIDELGVCIEHEFRAGNRSPREGQLEKIKEIEGKIERAGKKLKLVRLDGAGYVSEIIDYLEEKRIKYVIGASKNENMLESIKYVRESEWKEHETNKGEKREYIDMGHSTNKTGKGFRVVVERKEKNRELFDRNEYEYRCIATNIEIEEKRGEEIIKLYNERGRSENYHKEVKRGFKLSYMPSGELRANELWFSMGILGYNIFIVMKRIIKGRGWGRKTIERIRYEMINVCGRIIQHARKEVLQISGVGREIYEIYKKIMEWKPPEKKYA